MCICLISIDFPQTISSSGPANKLAHWHRNKPTLLNLSVTILVPVKAQWYRSNFFSSLKCAAYLKKKLNLSLSYCTLDVRTLLPQTVTSPIYSHLILGLLFSFTNVASNNSFCFLTQPWICCQLKQKINRNLHLQRGFSGIQLGEPPAFLFGRK